MTYETWWEDFASAHDEWKCADQEALRKAAFLAGQEQLKEELAARDLVIEQMRDGIQAFIDEHEECEDNYGWLASVCSQEAVHVADELLAVQPSADALKARDRKRDAALLRAAKEYTDSSETDTELDEIAAMRESGEWEPDL